MKDLEEVRTIIRQQITRDLALGTTKIDQSAFIRDLVIEKGFIDCNATLISMKASLAIDIPDADDYDITKLHKYQWLIGKLMYLVCKKRPEIAFVVGQLNKHNADPRKCQPKAAKRVVQYLKKIM